MIPRTTKSEPYYYRSMPKRAPLTFAYRPELLNDLGGPMPHQARLLARVLNIFEDVESDEQQRWVHYLVTKYGLPRTWVDAPRHGDHQRERARKNSAAYRERQRLQASSKSDDANDDGASAATSAPDDVVLGFNLLENNNKNGHLGQETTLQNLKNQIQERKNQRHQAVEVLRFLNQKAEKNFREIDTNLKLIEARLRSGASVQDCKAVIAFMCRKWGTDARMSPYLRPATLFAATNFEQYLGELAPEEPSNV